MCTGHFENLERTLKEHLFEYLLKKFYIMCSGATYILDQKEIIKKERKHFLLQKNGCFRFQGCLTKKEELQMKIPITFYIYQICKRENTFVHVHENARF